MLKLLGIVTILFVHGNCLAENSNTGDCTKFQYDHEMMKKVVEIEHDHDVMKYLLSRYQQLEDTNLETAKILESQESLIRSLQTDMQRDRRSVQAKFDEHENAIAINGDKIEKTNETISSISTDDVPKLKVEANGFAKDLVKLQEESKVHTDNIIALKGDSKTCSDEVKSLKEEMLRHGDELEELKTKYKNLTEVKSRDCEDIFTSEKPAKSGIFRIYPTSNFPESGLSVFCDMTTQGGGWIVIQRRQDGSEDFYRGWQDYKRGFGKLNSEFWLGLDNIHGLVSGGKWELLINMRDDVKGEKYARYETFSVGPESGGYVLTVGDYLGDAGDALTYHNGMKFTTKDKDNDRYGTNCASKYTGAWWHNSCQYSNLNGVYGKTPYKGPRWHTFSGADPVEFVEMKIKRKI